jgi:peptide/nickel transport system substrate-binding protein
VETDKAKRDDMIAQAYRIVHEDAGYIPLHQQSLVWGVSKKVHVVQRPDNQILFYWFRKD